MKNIFLLTAIILLTGVIDAQDKVIKSFTLQEAVQYALENNYNIKNAKLDEAKAKARNWEILTTGMPQINGNLDYDYYFKTPIVPAFTTDFQDFGPVIQELENNDPKLTQPLNTALGSFNNISFVLPNTVTAGAQLSQLIFDARYFIGVKATKDLLLSARLTTQVSDLDVRNNVTKAYYQAEAAQEAKSLLQDNMKLVDKLLDDTRRVYQQGLTEEVDVDRLELAKATLGGQINMQNRLADVALANLKYQMGLSLGDEVILHDKLADLRTNAGIALENKFDPSMRPEYQLLTTAVKLLRYDVAQKRSGYYPSLMGFINYSENSQAQAFSNIFHPQTIDDNGEIIHLSSWYPQGFVGFSLKVPIFDAGQKSAQVKQSKLELQKTQNQLEDFKNASQLQFQVAQSTLNSAITDEAISQKSLDLSKKIYDRNQVKFENGVGSSFELEQAEQDYTTNQLKYIQSLTNLLNAKADLDKAMGVK